VAELIEMVDRGIQLVTALGRQDLRRRLIESRRRLLEPSIRVMVVGEFKQGKSKLINALVNAPVCPVDDDVATAVPTVVRQGTAPAGFLVLPAKAGDPGEDPVLERRPVELADLGQYVSERGNPRNERGLAAAEVFLPRKILSGGLALVDSPGVGGLNSAHSLTTLTALPSAHAMLLVSDASQEYTEPEIQFLKHALRITPNVACVLSKTDLYPSWRQVADLDRRHLDAIRPDIPLIPVSSDLRMHAVSSGDAEVNAESGFPELVTYIRRDIVGKAEALQRRAVAQDLATTAEHLTLALQSELGALTDPQSTPRVIADLEAAKARTDELRRRSSKWQTTLNDGATDLIADMEHDLRDRMRSIQRDADAAIDQGDPGPVWGEIADWLSQRVAAAVSDTFVWTSERAEWLSEQVAAHFAESDVALPILQVEGTDGVLDTVESVPALDPGNVNPLQKLLIGMRGSYGGVLMIGLVTGIMGMSLINPFSLAAGLLIGGKAYRDDKQARLKRRQAEAKSLVKRQLDEVNFQVGKQLKDRLRLVQRATRDHFTEIADEHHRSLSDSVLSAQKAATLFTKEREQRVKGLTAQLKEVEALRVPVAEQPVALRRVVGA
jgi:hypothetical protein